MWINARSDGTRWRIVCATPTKRVVDDEDLGAGVFENVLNFRVGKPVVQRHDGAAAPRDGVVKFEIAVIVVRHDGDSAAIPISRPREGRRPRASRVHATLAPRQPVLAIDQRSASRIDLRGAPQALRNPRSRHPAPRVSFD